MAENETLVDPHPSKEEEAIHGNEEHMRDVQKPSGYSYSESDSDSGSDDETQAKVQTEAVELELYNNPSNYDAHVRVKTDNAHPYTHTRLYYGSLPKCEISEEEWDIISQIYQTPPSERSYKELIDKNHHLVLHGLMTNREDFVNKRPPKPDNSNGTGKCMRIIQEICHSWVRFEREYGSVEDFDLAVQKVTPPLQELQLFKLQQENKTVGAPTDERENPVRKNAREKRKPVSSSMDEQPPAKHRKDLDQKNKKAYGNDKGQGRHLDEANEVALVHDSKADSVSTKETKNRSPIKPVIYNDMCTAFISNLSLQATDKDLRSFFSDVGGVVDIRILTDQDKRSRGLAYVDFSDDAYLAAAVEKNKQSLLDKRLSIVRSDPQRGRGKKTSGCSYKFDRGTADNRRSNAGETAETSGVRRGPQLQSASQRRGDDVQLIGKNTFAMPRNVRAVAFPSRNKAQSQEAKEVGDENPKSNEEFRKMFLKD